MSFGGGGNSAPPPLPEAPPPPPNPPMFGANATKGGNVRKPASGGFAGTILGGITTPASTSNKTLLGS